MLPPDLVPLPWLRAIAARSYPELNEPGDIHSDPWPDAVRRLAELRLLTPVVGNETDSNNAGADRLVKMHRILGAILRHRMETHQVWAETATGPLELRRLVLVEYVQQRCAFLEDVSQVGARWELLPLAASALLLAREVSRRYQYHICALLFPVGNLLLKLDRPAEAFAVYQAAEGLYREFVEVEGRRELRSVLALSLNDKGNALQALGRSAAALEAYQTAEGLNRELIEVEGRRELRPDLAMNLNNKGSALRALGPLAEALEVCQAAEELYRELVEVEGRRELRSALALNLNNKGNALQDLGRPADALETCQAAEGLYRELVEIEGRREL